MGLHPSLVDHHPGHDLFTTLSSQNSAGLCQALMNRVGYEISGGLELALVVAWLERERDFLFILFNFV